MNEIKLLPLEDWNIVKTIEIEKKLFNGDIKFAEIVYLRKFTATYKMAFKEPPSEDDRFLRYLYGIPQDEYPNDILDKCILTAVRDQYPNAEIKNSLMIFSTDLDELQRYREKTGNISIVIIEPEPDFMLYHDGLPIINIPLQIYEEKSQTGLSFDNDSFTLIYHYQGYAEFEQITNDLKLTMKNISIYF